MINFKAQTSGTGTVLLNVIDIECCLPYISVTSWDDDIFGVLHRY